MKRESSGFSLIELVIAMAVVAILAAIAYPSYQNYIREARRADAQSVMLQAAQWMERFYTDNLRYDQNRAGTAVNTLFSNSGFTTSPNGGAGTQTHYGITLTNVNATTYTLNAAPDSHSDQVHDPCKTLTLNEQGAKGVAGGATKTAAECWN